MTPQEQEQVEKQTIDELTNASEPTLYRSEAEAVKCKHLQMSPLIRTSETVRPMNAQSGPVLLPHQVPSNGRMMIASVTVWPSCPPLGLVCDHPKVVNWAHRLLPEAAREGTNHVETRLECCRLCPFFLERTEM